MQPSVHAAGWQCVMAMPVGSSMSAAASCRQAQSGLPHTPISSIDVRTVAERKIDGHCASASHHNGQEGSPGAQLASMQKHSSCWRLFRKPLSHSGYPWTGADGGRAERMVSAEGGLTEAGHQMTSCRRIADVSWQFKSLQQPAAHAKVALWRGSHVEGGSAQQGSQHSQPAHTAKQTVNASMTACSSIP